MYDMVEILFLPNDHTLIPSALLRAARDFEGFAAVHLEYWVKSGGMEGLSTYQDAFEYLTRDMREHDLPVRYSSFNSFRNVRDRNATKLR